MFSFSHDPERLRSLAAATGGVAGTPAEAAAFGDVLILAVWFPQVEAALAAAGNIEGKTLVTCVSALQPDFKGEIFGMPTQLSQSAAESIAARLPGTDVVEAFNLTFAETLHAPNRDFGSERPSLPYCGDSLSAKQRVADLIRDCGYDPIDAGPLRTARSLETLASVWVQTAVVSNLFPQVALKFLRR